MANFITLFRLPLLTVLVVLLNVGNETVRLWCIALLLVLMLMDTLDGFIARSFKQVSLLGSVLDIVVDRTVEVVLWVVYSHFRLIPVIVPLIIIVRGVATDAVRAVRLKEGVSPFQQAQARLSQFLVASPFMRGLYGITKGLAFIVLTLDLSLRTSNPPAWEPLVHTIAMVLSWLAVSACLARGLPVLIEGFRYLKSQNVSSSK